MARCIGFINNSASETCPHSGPDTYKIYTSTTINHTLNVFLWNDKKGDTRGAHSPRKTTNNFFTEFYLKCHCRSLETFT